VTPFYDKNSLVVVVTDDITIREGLQPKSTIDVVLQVLHRDLVPEVLVVQLWTLLLDCFQS